jgi:hypothetical protein
LIVDLLIMGEIKNKKTKIKKTLKIDGGFKIV